MALLPPSGTHKNPDAYAFAQVSGGNLISPLVVPSASQAAATLGLNNGASPATFVEHYMTKTAGGGLSANHYQAFLYGASVGGDNDGEIFDVYGLGNNWTVMSMNRGFPLDPARLGTFTGTGAPINIAVPSIVAGSRVGVAFVAGALPGAVPVVVITPNVGFSVNAAAGAIYNYEVVG